MEHPEDENFREKRPVFLTVLCILTFIGSGWAVFSSITAYNTAEDTVGVFSESLKKNKEMNRAGRDTLVIESESDTFSMTEDLDGTNVSISEIDRKKAKEDSLDKQDADTVEFRMDGVFGEKIKKNVMDMMSVEKLQNSAIGSFVAALFTLAGAFFMFRLRKTGFYLYILGIAIGIAVPFYIYAGNLLAIGMSAFSSFFGLIFIALYALNLKSMR